MSHLNVSNVVLHCLGDTRVVRESIAVMNVECGNVIIELYPDIAPKAVERFKILIEQKMYDGSAFYKVSENTFV